MNSMKLAFKKVRDYLGRDSHGIALLEKAEALANELRKENAKLRQETESAKQKAEDAIAKQVDCQQRLREEQDLRTASEAKLRQSEVTINRLQGELQPKPPPDASEPLNSEIAIRRQMKTLRLDGFKWPARYWIAEIAKTPQLQLPAECYDVADIIRNWSGKELLKLGRFIALESIATTGMTVLYSSQKLIDKEESTTKHLIGLLENCMTTADEDEEEARFVGSTAEPPPRRLIERNV